MEIEINQDIRKFKTKDIGAFSFREAGFIVAGVGVVFGMYKLVTSFITVGGIEEILPICLLPAVPIFLFGFFKPYGMSFKDFLRTYFVEEILTARILKWQSDFRVNPYEFAELFGEEYALSNEEIEKIYFAHEETDEKTAKSGKKKKKK